MSIAPVIALDQWRQHRIRPAVEAENLEPTQLYGLVVLALVLHTGTEVGGCRQCGTPWPCAQARLAFRLREGF